MIQNKQNILVTHSLEGQQREYARILGLEPIEQPALEFNFPEYWDEVLKTINDHPKSDWVFTSKNGVYALEQLMNSGLNIRPEIRVFAVGTKTQQALSDIEITAHIPSTENSFHLADKIIKEGKSDSVIYFHGNLSRDEMIEKLNNKSIEVIELEVYQTIIKKVILPSKPVGAILFYSPSGVEAFQKGTGFGKELPPLFAIGPTTAGALKKKTDQPVLVSDKPSTEALLRKVSEKIFKEEKNLT